MFKKIFSCDLKTESTLGSIDFIPSTKTHLSSLLEAGSSDSKEFSCNARDLCSIPGSGRSPGEGNGNPFQYSCPESSMDRGACRLQSIVLQRVGHD